eukprot:jgi/Botrbrau1/14146/Bobra.182_3s0087.1
MLNMGLEFEEMKLGETVVENGKVKCILGYTWPGIEYGEPPTPKHTYFEYVDALRFGDLSKFLEIERACKEWWTVLLDRGKGSALHFAVSHGRMEAAKFLVEERGAEVNQQEMERGWTPLHHCAYMAHHPEAPYLALFEYLLQKGADPSILTTQGHKKLATGETGPQLSVLDLVVDEARGRPSGELKAQLEALIEKYKDVPKRPAFTYSGPSIGPVAKKVLKAWEEGEVLLPPPNWRPPPPAGYLEAQGMRRASGDPWRPAGNDDGSRFMRPMTGWELAEQSRLAIAAADL